MGDIFPVSDDNAILLVLTLADMLFRSILSEIMEEFAICLLTLEFEKCGVPADHDRVKEADAGATIEPIMIVTISEKRIIFNNNHLDEEPPYKYLR